MYESYTVLISALLLAGQKSTVDDGAAAVVLLAACGFLVTLWVPSRTLRRARRISAGHTWVPADAAAAAAVAAAVVPSVDPAAAAAGACFSLGSHYTPVCLGLAALGAVLMRPAWEGAPGSTSASSRSVVTAIDTELLLLQTVATEAASPALGIRIACLAVAGVALLNFVATAFVSEESHAWLRRLTRFLGPALMLAVIVVDDNLTTFQNAVMTAHLVWFLLPPTDFGPSAASVAAKELKLK